MRRSLFVVAGLLPMLALSACGDGGPARTAADVRSQFATRFVEGVDYGLSGRIKARAVDPTTNDLLDVSIEEIDKSILHADRGEIIVDTERDTVSIRLIGVTSADTESGTLATVPMYVTEAIALGYDVRD